MGGNTTVYKYDKGGNLQFKKIYAYSTAYGKTFSELLNGTSGKTVNYGYGNSENKDLLTSYNGSGTLAYNGYGNPEKWFKHGTNGSSLAYTLQWGLVSNLITITDDDTQDIYTYIYNDQGIRTEKIINDVSHKYYLQGEQIIAERYGNKLIKFYYDGTGVCGFNYNGTDYYYQKNIQGDILKIFNGNGTLYAEYSYDAWGKCTVKANVSGVAAINPFRYLGYYFDDETCLYYLNARYYDPEIGRFISPDSIDYLIPVNLNGVNFYVYCLNNPISFIDVNGFWPAPFIYKGYKIMFHPPRGGNGQQYHVHVDGKGKHFAQNLDGSPHDGLTGVPPKDIRNEIAKRTGGKWRWRVSNYVYLNNSMPNVLWSPYADVNLFNVLGFPSNQSYEFRNLWLPAATGFSMNIIDPYTGGMDLSLPVFPYPNIQGNSPGVVFGVELFILIVILLLIPGPQPI